MDYIVVILVLIFGFFLKNNHKNLNSYDHKILDQLYVFHMAMSVLFFIYVSGNGGDAWYYWLVAKESNIEVLWLLIVEGHAHATHYMHLLCYIPANVLDLSFFTGCMIFGVLGYWGILYLYITLKELFPLLYYMKHVKLLSIPVFPFILFLPNFHFWSAGIGKDTLLFYCACAFFYAINKIEKRWPLIIVLSILAYPIRPHILLFLMAGYAASFIVKSKMLFIQKLAIIIIAFILFLPLLNNVLEFAEIDEASVASFSEFGERKADALSDQAGSAIDISNLPYPLQVFTFLYRPLFIDAPNVLGLFSSVENIIWLILSFRFFSTKPLRIFKNSNYVILASFLYWLIGALAFAPILGNLGIIIRERNMFLPGFIIFALAGIYNSKQFNKFKYYYAKSTRKQSSEDQLANITNPITK